MYKYKYQKYKNKYDTLKKIQNARISNDNPNEKDETEFQNKDVDWYLFFDLLQVSYDIINLTESDDIIILVGDTPSYLAPFLKQERKVEHLAFSNKPFGCLNPPYAYPSKDKSFNDVFTPTAKNLELYFTYLDVNTNLTRKFVKDNWNQIVLVDSSSGSSIHGVSIFFNRYVGNIKDEDKNKIDCTNIDESQPLQFIQLVNGYSKSLNLAPESAEKFYPDKKGWTIRNYNPELIIHIGASIFYHKDLFMLYDAYPRILPFYSVRVWDVAPNLYPDPSLPEGLANIQKLEKLLKIYSQTKKSAKENYFTNEQIWKEISQVEPKYQFETIDGLAIFLYQTNLEILSKKWYSYFVTNPIQ